MCVCVCVTTSRHRERSLRTFKARPNETHPQSTLSSTAAIIVPSRPARKGCRRHRHRCGRRKPPPRDAPRRSCTVRVRRRRNCPFSHTGGAEGPGPGSHPHPHARLRSLRTPCRPAAGEPPGTRPRTRRHRRRRRRHRRRQRRQRRQLAFTDGLRVSISHGLHTARPVCCVIRFP